MKSTHVYFVLLVFVVFVKAESSCGEDALDCAVATEVTADGESVLLEDKVVDEKSDGETTAAYAEPIFVTFWNHMKQPVRIVWKNVREDQDDVEYMILEPKGQTAFTTYQSHVWYAKDDETGENLQEITMFWAQSVYSFETLEVRNARDEALEVERRIFMTEYKERTGLNWLAVYPRKNVSFHMWSPIEVGTEQLVTSNASLWHNHTKCSEDDPLDCSVDLDRPEEVDADFVVRTMSVSPQVFHIPGCLSEDEADLIVSMVQGRLTRSLVSAKGIIDPDRTSSTCWVGHDENDVMDNIFNRIADILQIPRHNMKNMLAAEHLQVVRYYEGQEYKTHHDYMDPAIHAEHSYVMRGNNRLATFLFYLHPPEEGGGTGFPESTAGEDGKGIIAKLPKGDAVLFYSMLPDGNLDIASLHSGNPVEKGVKYISNLWIWEPRFR